MLKDIDIFSGLNAGELAAIAAETSDAEYGENETVIRQGESGETVFLIIEEKEAEIKAFENGNELLLDHIAAGQTFGEMAPLNPGE